MRVTWCVRARLAAALALAGSLLVVAPALVPTAIANWQGLSPEERWWLYTMTAAATGHFQLGRNRVWRKATGTTR